MRQPDGFFYKPGASAPGAGRPGTMDPGGYVRAPSAVVNAPLLTQSLQSNYGNYRQLNQATVTRNNAYRSTSWNSNWHWRPRPQWGIGYYNNFYYDNSEWNMSYLALQDYAPTPFIFDVGVGQFYAPGHGYANALPFGYREPLTVKVTEWMVVEDAYGQPVRTGLFNTIETEPHVFFYNAFWDDSAGSYVYRDYQEQLHFVTFPWLSNW